MIKVSVFYPKRDGSRFDIDYYCNSHMPMVHQKCGAALKKMEIDHGIAGGTPGSSPTYACMGHLFFDSVEAFQTAFGPHAKEIMADIPNYTDVSPIVQISEVRL
ncbi:MAG TPA: EthD family reductase [Burkholderiales bacterium]|nr:EthD family reductase [Burkholderiales bacterium]